MPRPRIKKGRGISGALAYVLGEGYDDATGKRIELAEGATPRAVILGGQNFGFAVQTDADLDLARRTMEWNGLPQHQSSPNFKCENDCFHASISWEKGAEVSHEAMIAASQSFLQALGMSGAQAVFIAHHDTKCPHVHIVASRIDPETGKTYSMYEDQIKAQVWSIQWEREHGVPEARREAHRMFDAVNAHDGAAILDALTERNPTFTDRDLDRVLRQSTLSRSEVAEFKAEILADKQVIGLRATADAGVTRYTTREVYAAEMELLRGAQKLAADHSHGIDESRIEATAKAHTLKSEQADALQRLTGAEGFAMLWGEAGTGKSHTLNAVRAAYEAEGQQVIGMAWTNDVVQDMKGDGFTVANTIASELKKIENGRGTWNSKTVLIVDEAAQISTENLARVAEAARDAGAKLILAGDDAQLSSIERGGMFETLRQTHGAAILKDVQRVSDAEQKTAFGKMHQGEFLDALKTFDKAGGIHWTEKQADALRAMVDKYSADSLESPEKTRFLFAFSNIEVDALNQLARAMHRERGELGEDHVLQTARGEANFAEGDRIQLTGSGTSKADRDNGYSNGRVGTITAIEIEDGKPLVTVELDAKKGKEPQRIEFIVGEDAGEWNAIRHGYAGTIYKGQGKTLDESYICHSASLRASAAYVALTRHRDELHIFAAHETVKDLDAMAEGLKRKDNSRAATAYQIDEGSALRIDFDEAAQRTTRAAPEPDFLSGWRDVQVIHAAALIDQRQAQREVVLDAFTDARDFARREEPPPSRGPSYGDRVQAFLAAEYQERQQREQQQRGPEPQQPAELSAGQVQQPAEVATGKVDRVADFLTAESQAHEADKKALQELERLGFTSDEIAAKPQIRDKSGGQSL